MKNIERTNKRPSLAERRILVATGLGLAASLTLAGCSAEQAPASSEQSDTSGSDAATPSAEQPAPSSIAESAVPTAEASAGDTLETSGEQPTPPSYMLEAPSAASLEISTGLSADELGKEIIKRINQWTGTGQVDKVYADDNDEFYENTTEDFGKILADRTSDVYAPAVFGDEYDRPDNSIIGNEIRLLTEEHAKQMEQYVVTGGVESKEIYNGWLAVDGPVKEQEAANGNRLLSIPLTEWATVDNIVGYNDAENAEQYADGSRRFTYEVSIDESGQFTGGDKRAIVTRLQKMERN